MNESIRTKNPLSIIGEKIKQGEQGNYFQVGLVTAYNETPHTASVKLPLLDNLEIDNVRIGTVYVGDGFGLKMKANPGDEVLVCFPQGNPTSSDAVILLRFWGMNIPPKSGENIGAELIFEDEQNGRIVIKQGLLRMLMSTIEIGAQASYHLLLAEPTMAKYNAHLHAAPFPPLVPTSLPYPQYLLTPATDQTLTVTVQR